MGGKTKLHMITVRWEDTGIDILRMEVSSASSIQTMHAALVGFETLKGKQWDYIYRGREIPSEFYNVFTASVLEGVLLLRPKAIIHMPVARSPRERNPEGQLAIAKKSYHKEGKKRLQFDKGDRLLVVQVPEDSPWWWCEYKGVLGYAPSSYLDVVYDDDDDLNETKGSGSVGYFESSYKVAPNVVGALEGILGGALGSQKLEEARNTKIVSNSPKESDNRHGGSFVLPPPENPYVPLQDTLVLPPPGIDSTLPPSDEPTTKSEKLKKKAERFRKK